MSDVSAVLSLPYLLPAQAQKHVTHNEALARLDVAVQLAVIARDIAVPPTSPTDGDRYLVPTGASGDWVGRDGNIAVYDMNTWVFQAPVAGWVARVLSEDAQIRFDGTVWQNGAGALSVDSLGVNGAADAINRLTSVAPATLLTHAGAGHQLKVNKAGASDTASLLFQTDWSGRAEMGTTGTDEFAIKVSADGIAWSDALRVDMTDGAAEMAAGLRIGGQTAYHQGNLLGQVSQTAGIPTGAVIERGSTVTGDYIRWTDGTQICTHRETLSFDATAAGAIYRDMGLPDWVYPAPFATAPAVTFVPEGSNWGSTDSTVSASSRFLFRHNGASGNVRCTMLAVGRWA